MQKRMAAWEKKSPEPDVGQTREQKEARQRLEVSKNLIAALQEEIRDQAEQMETMRENMGIWQERSEQAERLVVELREKLAENHTQVEETRKVIIREMERVKEYTASQEALEAQKQSLEAEMKAKTEEHIKLQAQCQRGEKELETRLRETEELRAQLKKGAVEKDLCKEQIRALKTHLEDKAAEHMKLQSQLQTAEAENDCLEDQVQHLKALLEESAAKEAATDTEREQLRQQMQTSRRQVQALEEQIKTFQEQRQSLLMEVGASTKEGVELWARLQEAEKSQDQKGEEIQSLKTLLKESTARELALQEGVAQQPVQTAQIPHKRLAAISSQLEGHASRVKTGYEEHLQELKGLKEALVDAEKMLKAVQPMLLKEERSQEPPRTESLQILREGKELEQQEKNAKVEALLGVNPMKLKEEITTAVMEGLNQRWSQWVVQYTTEMSDLREKLEKVASGGDATRLAALKQKQQKKLDQGPETAQIQVYSRQGAASIGEKAIESPDIFLVQPIAAQELINVSTNFHLNSFTLVL
ncbi:trichohyalin-like [Alligator mississippiensis]|uniref:Trichohyalin-like n=1 Tax=Alligator mississippiensis TaxID=8496 RepID=A0A151M826_ALLMI|nr:trichohyalin-like [Alligator mississippiensis]